MKNPGLFEYLAAFVTIVLAIALSDMLMSLHRLLLARKRVTWNVIPLAAALLIFLSLLSEFFSIHSAANVTSVSFAYLVLLVSVSGLIAMAAFVVLPDEVPAEGLSLWNSYLEKRTQLWILMVLAWAGDMARMIFARSFSKNPPPLTLLAILPFMLIAVSDVIIFAILAWRKERWVHALGIVLIFASILSNFLGWDIH